MTGNIILYCFLGLLGGLLLFTIIRSLCVRPSKEKITPVKGDIETAKPVTEILSGAVKIPTVTAYNEGDDQSSFLAFHRYLEESFPCIFARATKTVIHDYSLVLSIEGSDKSLLPGCILAHQDVVPASKEGWEHDPFSGDIADGFVHGRGSQDMKSQLIASMMGLELLLKEGKEPKRTIFYCFGHDEENTGRQGAQYISRYLQEQNIRFEFVLDEGGTILSGDLLGIKGKYVALIGTCEKGYVDYTLTAKRDGGHASSPKKKSSVDELAEAVYDLSRTPMKRYWSKPCKELFKTLAPHMNPLFKYFLVNRDIYSPLLKVVFGLVNPVLNSLLRTTFAFTQLKGSPAPNVIPVKAEATVNCRINIGQTKDDAKKHIQKVVGKNIQVTEQGLGGFNPSPVSLTDTDTYRTLVRSIQETYDDFIVAPYPFIAATDSKWYYPVCNGVYRFTPFINSMEDEKQIHGLNEKCRICDLEKSVLFYRRLFENMAF